VPISVRRVRAGEWRALRALRLRALAEAPNAFGSTLARESAFPDDTWRERAAAAALRQSIAADVEALILGTKPLR